MSSKPVRLPPLPRLKVKKPVIQKQTNRCFVIMSSLLNCWASNGEGAKVCKTFEVELKDCMVTQKKMPEVRSSINYHASRLYPKIGGKKDD